MYNILIDLFVAVGANVIAYYICMWLDSHRKGKQAQRTPSESPLRGGSLLCDCRNPDRSLAYFYCMRSR